MTNLIILQAEVQARCDALTGISTSTEILDCALAAFAVQTAGGAINRATLDVQLQRVVDESAPDKPIEQLILAAASSKNPTPPAPAASSAPIGSSMPVGMFSNPLITLNDGSEWLRSGYAIDATTYTEAASLDHLQVLSGDVVYNPVDKTISQWATDGAGIWLVRFTDGTGIRSLDNGLTWSVHAISGSPTGVAYNAGRFVTVENTATIVTFRYSTNGGANFSTGRNYTTTGMTLATAKIVWSGEFFAAIAVGLASFVKSTNGQADSGVYAHSATLTGYEIHPAPGGGFIYTNGAAPNLNKLTPAVDGVTSSFSGAVTGNLASIATDGISGVVVNVNGDVTYSPATTSPGRLLTTPTDAAAQGAKVVSVSFAHGSYWLGITKLDGSHLNFMYKGNGQDWELVQIAALTTGNGGARIFPGFVFLDRQPGQIRAFSTTPQKVGRGVIEKVGDSVLAWRIK